MNGNPFPMVDALMKRIIILKDRAAEINNIKDEVKAISKNLR